MRTDKDWKKWGKTNPYYGVISHDRYSGQELDEEQLHAFYTSGEKDVDGVAEEIARLGGPDRFHHGVDFGCGVGRLTQPLAKYAKQVTGLDVSVDMIELARENTPKKLRKKITFDVSDKQLHALPERYDLVHSYIVFQHIPPKEGIRIITHLLSRLESGGFAALHITYAHQASRLKKSIIWLRENILPLRYLFNIYKGKAFNTPAMKMHAYDLGLVIDTFKEHGVDTFTVKPTNHGGYLGVMIIGKKQ